MRWSYWGRRLGNTPAILTYVPSQTNTTMTSTRTTATTAACSFGDHALQSSRRPLSIVHQTPTTIVDPRGLSAGITTSFVSVFPKNNPRDPQRPAGGFGVALPWLPHRSQEGDWLRLVVPLSSMVVTAVISQCHSITRTTPGTPSRRSTPRRSAGTSPSPAGWCGRLAQPDQ